MSDVGTARRPLQGLRQPTLTEAEYVLQELEATREYIASLKVSDKTTPEAIRQRLERTERYARWRYQSFLGGEIASL
jgi:hypothetical protein